MLGSNGRDAWVRVHREQAAGSGEARRRGRPRRVRGLLLAFAVVLIASIGLRMAAPYLILRYVDRSFDHLEGYDGRIRDVDLALLRGAYRIEDVSIFVTDGEVPAPLFEARSIDLSIQWSALLRGGVVGEIELAGPVVNFVSGPTASQSQSGEEVDWREPVSALFPIEISRLAVRDGEVHFRNFHSRPAVDVWLEDVSLVARNLTNVEDRSRERPATLVARARSKGGGVVELDVRVDPFAESPDFTLRAALRDVDVAQLNDFFRAYAGVDLQRGTLTLLSELVAGGGRFEGYVKPILSEVDVLDTDSEDDMGVLATLWESLVGGLAEALENQPEDQLAARIPVAGAFDSPTMNPWSALMSLFRNGFVEALRPRFEQLERHGTRSRNAAQILPFGAEFTRGVGHAAACAGSAPCA